MEKTELVAPAKLNLHLAVGGRRQDGFHEIESIFLALDFGDTLCFESLGGNSGQTQIQMDWQTAQPGKPAPVLPPEKNLVFRAVSLFRSRSGYNRDLKITVEKRIPLGGGLGGGSSDAAATLVALNRLSGCAFDKDSLAQMGASLGSDVPFFVYCGFPAESDSEGDDGKCTAWVSGRGEIVRPFSVPEAFRRLSFLLVNPAFRSDTAAAFRLLDDSRAGRMPERNQAFDGGAGSVLELPPSKWIFSNDFLPAFAAAGEPQKESDAYARIISGLKERGAGFASLSGSGSTCFGVFEDGDLARAAAGTFLKAGNYVFETCCLHSRQYHGKVLI